MVAHSVKDPRRTQNLGGSRTDLRGRKRRREEVYLLTRGKEYWLKQKSRMARADEGVEIGRTDCLVGGMKQEGQASVLTGNSRGPPVHILANPAASSARLEVALSIPCLHYIYSVLCTTGMS